MRAKQEELTEKDYDEFLNEVYGDINVCGLKYPASQVLYEVDPIVYRCGMADWESAEYENRPWICDECGQEYDSEEDAEECCEPEEDEEEEEEDDE